MARHNEPDMVTGFEHGLYNAVGEGLFQSGSSGTIVEVQSTTKRTGEYAARVHPSATVGLFTFGKSAGTGGYGRFYVYFITLPDADVYIQNWESGVGSPDSAAGVFFQNSDNTLRPFTWTTDGGFDQEVGSEGAVVTTGTWYRVDVSYNQGASDIECEIYVDGVQLASVTGAGFATNTQRHLSFGAWGNNNTSDVIFDDVCFIAGPAGTGLLPDYPIGSGKVVLLRPSSTVSISNAASFTDQSGSPIADPHLNLDDVSPLSSTVNDDWVRQDSAGATIFMGMEDLPTEATAVNSYFLRAGSIREGAGATGGEVSLYLPDETLFVMTVGDYTSTAAKGWTRALLAAMSMPTDETTVADIDAMQFYIASSDVSPLNRWTDMHLEVDYFSPEAGDPGGPAGREFPKIAARWTVVPHRLV